MLSISMPTYGLVIIIAVVAVQYGFAMFCLLKLAYLDIPKKQYALWNVFILLVFFIGGIVFLVYWSKVKDTKRIPPYVPQTDGQEDGSTEENADAENAEKSETENIDDNADTAEKDEKDDNNEDTSEKQE